jgi:hypothetical protein
MLFVLLFQRRNGARMANMCHCIILLCCFAHGIMRETFRLWLVNYTDEPLIPGFVQ